MKIAQYYEKGDKRIFAAVIRAGFIGLRFLIKHGKSIVKIAKKVFPKIKPKKGVPKATKNSPKATKGGSGRADAKPEYSNKTSVFKNALGTGVEIVGVY